LVEGINTKVPVSVAVAARHTTLTIVDYPVTLSVTFARNEDI
jgi:hypothetical protein